MHVSIKKFKKKFKKCYNAYFSKKKKENICQLFDIYQWAYVYFS